MGKAQCLKCGDVRCLPGESGLPPFHSLHARREDCDLQELSPRQLPVSELG